MVLIVYVRANGRRRIVNVAPVIGTEIQCALLARKQGRDVADTELRLAVVESGITALRKRRSRCS